VDDDRDRVLNRAEDLPAYLAGVLPEAVEAVEEVRLDYRDDPAIAAYGYVSLAFWWPVFEPAVKDGTDLGLVGRCFEVLEAMLSCPDQEVRDAAGIRVTPYLVDSRWWSLAGRYAGPATRADLLRLGHEYVVPRLTGYTDHLKERFPEYRGAIEEPVETVPGDWYVANALTRDVLVGEVLRSAVESGDEELLGRWYRVVEEVLASPDEELTDAVLHEVPRAAWGTAAHARASQLRAGPLLASAIDVHYGDTSWRTRTDWVDEPRQDLRTIASVDVYQFRGELLMHGRRLTSAADGWPTVEPFMRIPVASSPDEISAVVSGIFAELVEARSEPVHQGDEFVEFVGGVDWPTLFTESLLVTVELTPAAGEVRVWSHEGRQRSDLFVSPPIDSPISSNLRWGADLGAAVLAALYRSSTTGWVGPWPE